MLLLSGTAFCFYSGSLDFFHVQVQVRQSSSVLFSYFHFSSLLLPFSFSFPSFVTGLRLITLPAVFAEPCGYPCDALPLLDSRLQVPDSARFFFLAVSLVARKS